MFIHISFTDIQVLPLKWVYLLIMKKNQESTHSAPFFTFLVQSKWSKQLQANHLNLSFVLSLSIIIHSCLVIALTLEVKGTLHYMNLNPIAFEPPMTSHIRSQHIANINSEHDRHHFIINESVKLHFIIIK